jgi:sugar phosphate isomerase/epimerase
MKKIETSPVCTRRRVLAGALGAAAGAFGATGKKYSPRIVCNTYLWVQMFSKPVHYIWSKPDPLKVPPPSAPAPAASGLVWSEEQWDAVCSDLQYAGYKRMELTNGTFLGTPVEKILPALNKYGIVVNHIWHSGPLYPAEVGEKTIARTIDMLERARPLKSPDLVFDPFVDRGPLSDENARVQNRGLDRIGRELNDRGMKLHVHNHQGPMRYGAKEWLGVLHNTDPALVSMCLDMDWTLHAGTDPFPLLYEAGDKGRLGAVHLRTQHHLVTDQTMEDGGDIDFYKAAEYLKKIQFEGLLVEETEPMKETRWTRTIKENKRLARIWCEHVFGVSAKV